MSSALYFRMVALLAIVAAVLGASAYWWQFQAGSAELRAKTLAAADLRGRQLTDAVAGTIDLLLHRVDGSAQELAAIYAPDDLATFRREAEQVVGRFPPGAILQVAVIGPDGYLTFSNLGMDKPVFLGDREHFQVHAQASADQPFISKPLLGRVSKKWSIQFSRAIRRDGRFAGVVVLSVAPDYLHQTLARLQLDPSDAIALIGSQGDYLARNRRQDEALGQSLPPDRPFLGPDAPASGAMVIPARFDQVVRRYQWQRVGGYPVVVVLGLGEEAILGPVNEDIALDRKTGVLGTVVVVSLMAALVALLARLRARQAREVIQAQALRDERQRLRTIYDVLPVGITITDEKGQIIDCNPASEEILGLSRQEHLARRHDSPEWQVLRPDGSPMPPRELPSVQAQEQGETVRGAELQVVTPTGPRWLEVHATPLKEAGLGVVVAYADITARRQAEATLRDREARYRTVVNSVKEVIFQSDGEGHWTFLNAAWTEITGFPVEESLGGYFLDFVHPEDQASNLLRFEALIQGATPYCQHQVRYLRKDGGFRWVEVVAQLTRDAAGRVTGTTGTLSDLTEQIQGLERLRASEERLRATLEDSPNVAVQWYDAGGRVVYWNRASEQLYGWSAAEALGKTLDQMILSPEETTAFAAGLARIQAEKIRIGPREFHTHDRKGVERWVMATIFEIPGLEAGTPLFACMEVDVTDRKCSEAALLESRNLLQTIIDTVPVRVFWKDRESRYLGCNPPFAQDAGRSAPGELIGGNDFQMAWAEQASLYRADDQQVMGSGQARLNYEEPLTGPDGQPHWVRTSKVPLRNPAGEIIGVLGIYQDITEGKRVEAELAEHRLRLEELVAQRTTELLRTEARASHILESSADGLYGVDSEGRVTFINPAACAMLGYTPEQAIGRSAHALFHHSHADGRPYPQAECPAAGRALADGRAIRVDGEVYWHADGNPIPVMYAVHPMRPGSPAEGAVISFVDMTAQRAAEQAREQALAAAENLARVRSEFLANMSHEIRTPLNGVLGFATIGQRHAGDPERARDAFAKIRASGQVLLGVINDILDFSKIEAGKMSITAEATDLREVVAQALEVVAERAHAKGLELNLEQAPDFPAHCLSDPLRVSQILLNLLSNAVKFTEAGRITLSAGLAGGMLRFGIADTGIGMSAEELGRVFAPFEQADGSSRRKFGGSGLGLTITKRIVELMGGHLEAQSTPGAGSRFEVTLPYRPIPGTPPAGAAPTPADSPQPLAGLTVLVAEDHADNRQVLEECLGSAGARVVAVGNGQEACDRLAGDGPGAYAAVLLDVQMPVMDGYEAAGRIRRLDPGLPIIGQTAHAYGEAKERCFGAGMVDHIAKPIETRDLVRIILRHARRA